MSLVLFCLEAARAIGLYRDVWIAAIASSRKSLATQTAAICVRFHGRRVRHVYVTMQNTFLARKSALIYRRVYVRESPASPSIAMAYSRYEPILARPKVDAVTLVQFGALRFGETPVCHVAVWAKLMSRQSATRQTRTR